MNQKKNYEKLTNSEKKQIKDFMEWGTGKNDINSWGMPEQMTMHEKIRYSILFTLGILFLSILERKTVNCIIIVGIDVLMISILLIFAKKKDNLLVQTMAVFVLEWDLSIVLHIIMGGTPNTLLIVLLIHIIFAIGGLCTVQYCKKHNLYVNNETEKNKHKKANSISLFITSGAGAITIVLFNRLMGFIFGDEIVQIVITAMFMLGIGLIAFASSVYSLKIYYRYKFGLRTSFDIEF